MRKKKQRSQTPLKMMDELNLTPMLDLVFLLLIVFMITTPLLENAIDVTPPTQDASEVSEETLRTVNIDKNGSLFFQNEPVTEAQLTEKLRELKQNEPDAPIALRADGSQKYEEVIHILGIINKQGFKNASLITLEE